jgi:putative NADPH-quinone reductase
LFLYANPVAASFGAALHNQVVSTLRTRGHKTDDCDLYAEAFDPVMSERERIEYHDTDQNKAGVAGYASRLLEHRTLM